jgi:hypothetical protein
MRIQKVIYGVSFSLLLVAFIWAGTKAKRFIEIDKCLDSGGRWNHETKKCE